ncbi:MAG TPA: penicillin-binding protein 1B [Oligoflexus sp.]|nr:penicillin-binding protein 1B [Oligoflexus sp.]
MSVSRDKLRFLLRLWPVPIVVLLAFSAIMLYQMDGIVREKFEGKRWRLPSVVYARPLELHEGAPLRDEDLEMELQELSYFKVKDPQQPGEYSRHDDKFEIQRRGFPFWEGAEGTTRIEFRIVKSRVTDLKQDGKPSELSRLDPMKIGGIYATQKEDRKLVQLKQVPKYVIDALIAIEDREFYDHFGVSIKGISRAMWTNFKARRWVQGGSTLTQQLVKNFYLTPERSIKRKFTEMVYSVLLELHYSKEEILETYINEIYLGHSGDSGVHGFGLASEFYFGRPLEALSLDQAAVLAAIANGPSFYNPGRYPDRVKKRRNKVLALLLEDKKITKAAYDQARRQPIKVRPSLRWAPNRFPAFLDLVRRNLDRDYQTKDLAEEGLRIFSTLDPITQVLTEKAIADFMRRQGKSGGKLQVASVVVSESGEVQGVIGDKVAGFQGFNRALDAKRSIGSLAKPVVLLSALAEHSKYTLATHISDGPVSIPLSSGQVWEPQNIDHGDHGNVSLLTMLTQSYNRATVRLGREVGLKKVQETFRKLTGSTEIPDNPSIMLGALGMSPYEVAGMYYPFFSGGYRTDLKAVRGVQDHDGKRIKAYPSKVVKIFEPSVIHVLQYAMRAVIFEGTGRAAFSFMPGDLTAAGKTGTSNDQRDSWFAGFTGDKLVVSWVGNDANDPTRLTGSSGGLHVWAQIMSKISRQGLTLNAPPGVQYQWVDNATGLLSSADCQGVRYLPFVGNSAPRDSVPCPVLPETIHPDQPPATTGKEPAMLDWLFKLMQ